MELTNGGELDLVDVCSVQRTQDDSDITSALVDIC